MIIVGAEPRPRTLKRALILVGAMVLERIEELIDFLASFAHIIQQLRANVFVINVLL